MSQNQWAIIEAAIRDWSAADKVELARRLLTDWDSVSADESANQTAALQDLRAKLSDIEVKNPLDGRTNRDHDVLIYGALP